MWNKFRNNFMFSIEKQLQRPRILIISLLQRNNTSAQYPHLFSSLTKVYCISLCICLLKTSSWELSSFYKWFLLFVDHYEYSCFTWNHNHHHYNKLSVICKADAMSRRHLFSFCWVSSSIDSAKMLLKLSLSIPITSLVPPETMHLLHPLWKQICYPLILVLGSQT